ncbi:hypothetical protein PVAP13_9NG350528 [Panicum virgatum]|uniref:Uncharacterized protein n=1 Tax=Panicum virgatum TaxID=38727 RepID=A0A8T0MRI6_PANVG|nr:hypothetical protein PVAP13_9NG350528 [Panicum virgatum]
MDGRGMWCEPRAAAWAALQALAPGTSAAPPSSTAGRSSSPGCTSCQRRQRREVAVIRPCRTLCMCPPCA